MPCQPTAPVADRTPSFVSAVREKILIFRRLGREARPVDFDRSGPVYRISDHGREFSGIVFMDILADEILHLRVDILA